MMQNSFQIMLQTVLSSINRGPWWDIIPDGLRIIFPIVWFFVSLLVLAVVLYLAGLIVVGGKRALFSDAFRISLLGTVLSTIFFLFIPYNLIALLLSIFVWLLLIKRLYETRWLRAIAVGILAIIIFLAVTILLALVFDILSIFESFLPFMILML
jgi:hypothetical protein